MTYIKKKYVDEKGQVIAPETIAEQVFMGDGKTLEETLRTFKPGGGTPSEPEPYVSGIKDKALQMPNAVGGIAKGKTVGDLEKMTHNQLFDELLFPTLLPTFVNPSVDLKLVDYTALQEVGAEAPRLERNFSYTFHNGTVSINGVVQMPRAGEETRHTIYDNQGGPSSTPVALVIEGDLQYFCEVYYAEGMQPKDNKGNNAGTKLPAGSVKSAALVVNGSYPVFAGSQSIATKQTLKKWGGRIVQQIYMPAHTAADKICFKIPKKKMIAIKGMTPSGFKEQNLSNWELTTENIMIQGNPILYNVYTEKTDSAHGANLYEITF